MDQASDLLTSFCLSYIGARVITVFYKRNFSLQNHGLVLLIEMIAFLVALITRTITTNGLLNCTLVVLAVVVAQHYGWKPDEDRYKALTIALSICLSFCLNLNQECYISSSLIVATILSLRRTTFIKHIPDRRNITGPVYLVLLLTALRFTDSYPGLKSVLPMVTLTCTLIASTVFRPDNDVLMNLLLLPVFGKRCRGIRGRVHMLFESAGVFISAARLCLSGVPITYTIFGIINIFCQTPPLFKYCKKFVMIIWLTRNYLAATD